MKQTSSKRASAAKAGWTYFCVLAACHEVVHMLSNFLRGYPGKEPKIPKIGSSRERECGLAWERLALGGIVTCDDGDGIVRIDGQRVDEDYMQRCVDGSLDYSEWWLRPVFHRSRK